MPVDLAVPLAAGFPAVLLEGILLVAGVAAGEVWVAFYPHGTAAGDVAIAPHAQTDHVLSLVGDVLDVLQRKVGVAVGS